MSHFTQTFYHIIFSTKDRKPTIPDEYCEELYKYIWGILNKRNCKLYRINGTEDHIHVFTSLHPIKSLSDLVRDIKTNSSAWLKTIENFPKFRGWQKGYAAFTYSIRDKEIIINYIKNQKEHHKKENSLDEIKRILEENGIEIDLKFLE